MARTKPAITDPNPPKSKRMNRVPVSSSPLINNHPTNYSEVGYAQRPDEILETFCTIEEISHNDPELLALICDQYEAEQEERRAEPGRPTLYNPKISPRIAYVLASQHGFTDEMIAEVFCMKVAGLYNWKRHHPEFAKALWDGRMEFDCSKAVKGVSKRAAGYFLRDRKWSRVPVFRYEYDFQGKPHQVITGYEMAVTEESVKHLPPDVTAARYLLENRQPHLWKNQRQLDVNFKGAILHAHSNLGTSGQPLVELEMANLPTEVLLQIMHVTGNVDPMAKQEEIVEAEYEDQQ